MQQGSTFYWYGVDYSVALDKKGEFVYFYRNNNDPLPTGNTVGDLGSIFKDTDGKTYIFMTVDLALRGAMAKPDVWGEAMALLLCAQTGSASRPRSWYNVPAKPTWLGIQLNQTILTNP